jgi:uncharacterized protein YktA (UPF0223 family)
MILINRNEEIVMVAEAVDYKTTEVHMADYIESLQTLEEEMEPYKEQKRELRKEYEEQGWLSKEEIRLAVKAYRLLKNDIDMSALIDTYKALKNNVRGKSNES